LGLIIAFVLNAVLNFILGLLIAALLGPEEYGRYAIAFALANVINIVAFDWLRLAVLRFYSQKTRTETPAIRSTLGVFQSLMMAAAMALGAGFMASGGGAEIGSFTLMAAILAALAAGAFEYHAALARARFLGKTYGLLVIIKNSAAFILMGGAAWWFRDGAFVLIASALSVILGVLAVWNILKDEGTGRHLSQTDMAKTFATYAIPLVIANVAYQLIPLINRLVLAKEYNLMEAGYFSLAIDMGLRLFATLGSALDILLFQLAVLSDEMHGQEEAQGQVNRNAALTGMIMFPFAAGFYLILPAFEAALIPPAYQSAFQEHMLLLIPALTAFSMIQFALNPAFQIGKRTKPAVIAAMIALGSNIVLLFTIPESYAALRGSMALLGSYLIAMCIAGFMASRLNGFMWPWRDFALSALGSAMMIIILWPLRDLESPVLSLMFCASGGILIYGFYAYFFNIAGIKPLLLSRLPSRQ
jgi:O-antigen/teichoic acid export membrane protein